MYNPYMMTEFQVTGDQKNIWLQFCIMVIHARNDTLIHTCRCHFLALKYIYVHTLKDGCEVSWGFAVKVETPKPPLEI